MSSRPSSGGKQIDDFLDRCISTVVGRLEPAIGPMCGIGLMMEAAVGEGSAQPFVKEQEQESNLHAFRGEAVGIAGPISLQERMAFQLAQIVAELVETVTVLR